MAQVSLYADEATIGFLREESARLSVSVSAFVCSLIDRYRATRQAAWPDGYFERVVGSAPDFPDIDVEGIDADLDDSADWWEGEA